MNNKEIQTVKTLNGVLKLIPRLNITTNKVVIGCTHTRCYLDTTPQVNATMISKYTDFIARSMKLACPPIVRSLTSEGSLVLDIPNEERELVQLRSCLNDSAFKRQIQKGFGLPFVLGQDNSGTIITGDLADAPHVLIAGQSGSGKSVTMKCIANSLIAAYSEMPGVCYHTFLDPKGVEFVHYRNLPETHVYASTTEDIVNTLVYYNGLMNERYTTFLEVASFSGEEIYDLPSYNLHQLRHKQRILPFHVIFIDELADILHSHELAEPAIVGLVQKARAVGIHLVLATQRPSADVISGSIRANVPVKICCKVAQQVEGRVVFGNTDHAAHHLLGKGDMLYLDNTSTQPIRLQGAFTDITFLRSYYKFLKRGGRANVIKFSAAFEGKDDVPAFLTHKYSSLTFKSKTHK